MSDQAAGVSEAWRRLAALTPARVALGRTGAGLPTGEVLRFAMAHAQARDAVHAPLDAAALAAELAGLGLASHEVASAAEGREAYLRRPDLGRRLATSSEPVLDALEPKGRDLAVVVGDGLSATAVSRHAAALLGSLLPPLERQGRSLAPVIVAKGARVALGDAIAARLRARMVIVLIGERPGLSSPDSLGAYLTYAPATGRTDAERNCVSNIREGGLTYAAAALKLAWLIDAAFAARLTGVRLKDESGAALVARPGAAALAGP